MATNRAAAMLSALLFAQGLLGFAALFAVILQKVPATVAVASAPAVVAVR